MLGEVLDFFTSAKSMHYPNVCNIDYSNYVQDELTRIAVVAYDRESILGDKPKTHVYLYRTLRVKKT